jgi:hypothetical protein
MTGTLHTTCMDSGGGEGDVGGAESVEKDEHVSVGEGGTAERG